MSRAEGLATWAAIVIVAAVVGCSEGCAARGPDTAAARAARAQALVESGNVAYKQGDYRLAVRRYAAAAVERQDDPAAYYGMGMALSKLGRDEEARVAYARSRALTQGSGAAPAGEGHEHP